MSSNRLTHQKAFDLHTYLVQKKDQLKAKWEPLAEISAEASASLGFYVSDGNLKGALKTAGITRCERPTAAGGEDPHKQALKRIENQIAALAKNVDIGRARLEIALGVKEALDTNKHPIPQELEKYLGANTRTEVDSGDEPVTA